MMIKRERLLWVIFAGVLVFLYLLSSTNLIIKEKKIEVYPVSVVISDSSDDYYGNFRKGVEQAASEYNVDISFITLYEKGDAAQQMELVKREIDDGAEAVILEPAVPMECAGVLNDAVLASPLIITGSNMPTEKAECSIMIDAYKAGRKLAKAVVADNLSALPVCVFTESLEYGSNREFYDGVMSVFEEQNWKIRLYQKKAGDNFRTVIEETVYPGNGKAMVVALDAASTWEAAEIIGESPVYGDYIMGLYGTGTTPALLNHLDEGTIKGLLVSNQFDNGYLCVEKAVKAIRKQSVKEQLILDSYLIKRTDLRDRKFEKMLYPMD